MADSRKPEGSTAGLSEDEVDEKIRRRFANCPTGNLFEQPAFLACQRRKAAVAKASASASKSSRKRSSRSSESA